MKRWKIWLGLAVIFICGFALGVIVTLASVRHKISHLARLDSKQAAEQTMSRMSRRLNLRPEQQQKIGEIVRDTYDKFAAVRAQVRAELRPAIEDALARVEHILEPAQKRKFEPVAAGVRTRLSERLPDPGPGAPLDPQSQPTD